MSSTPTDEAAQILTRLLEAICHLNRKTLSVPQSTGYQARL
jgi:hypothetical protein